MSTPKATEAGPAEPLPAGVKVHHEEVSDTPAKSQVNVDLLVPEGMSETELRHLLEQVHAEVSRRTGFRYHPKATHVAIRTFATAEHADSGMGQWSAQLLRLGARAKPTITIAKPVVKEKTLSAAVAALPEKTRRQIWKEAVLAEDRATKETQDLPLEVGAERSRELTHQYKGKVAQKYGLSTEQLREIELEGLAKNWPFPAF